jgi:hypothetical protein
MGSGKGKTRRIKSAIVVSQRATGGNKQVVFDESQWGKFIKSAGTEWENIYEYYLGHRMEGAYDVEKVITELLKDAVEAGAVMLPPSCEVDDFEFEATMPNSLNIILEGIDGRTRMEQETVLSWHYQTADSSMFNARYLLDVVSAWANRFLGGEEDE